MHGEIVVGGAPSGDKVVFAGADGAFCGVLAMIVWCHELVLDFLFVEEVFEDF